MTSLLSFFESMNAYLFIAFCSLITAIFLFQIEKKSLSLLFVFLFSLFLGLHVIHLEPFLNLWDEQFHALVAKNMMTNPLKPTLFSDPVLPYSPTMWAGNHVWLHKQPLFLWQMALSLKLFGLNEVAVRVPSIIMISFSAIMIYRIGKISINETVGFYGAILFASLHYILELSTGYHSTDHNDIAFLFYVTASFWAWFEYQNKPSIYWVIAIGVFSGCAILVKWLVGLLIYAVWFFTLGSENKKNYFKLKTYKPILLAFVITLIVFVPWQLYILSAFNVEATHELRLNSEHFFKPIEGHGGDVWYHFKVMKQIYDFGDYDSKIMKYIISYIGDIVPYIIFVGWIFLIWKVKDTKYKVALFSPVVIVYLFFSIASTKMDSFCLIVSPILILGIANFIYTIISWIKSKVKFKPLMFVFTLILIPYLSIVFINFPRLKYNHCVRSEWSARKALNMGVMNVIKKVEHLSGKNYVIYVPEERLFANIPLMFYLDCVSYSGIPSQELIDEIKKKKYSIAIVSNVELPSYILDDSEIQKIN